jgi:hypothetical protein
MLQVLLPFADDAFDLIIRPTHRRCNGSRTGAACPRSSLDYSPDYPSQGGHPKHVLPKDAAVKCECGGREKYSSAPTCTGYDDP